MCVCVCVCVTLYISVTTVISIDTTGFNFNESTFIILPTNALEFYAICQTKDLSLAVLMVHKPLFYFSKIDKLQTF